MNAEEREKLAHKIIERLTSGGWWTNDEVSDVMFHLEQAEQAGRSEGLEEAAQIAVFYRTNGIGDEIADAIRALKGEKR